MSCPRTLKLGSHHFSFEDKDTPELEPQDALSPDDFIETNLGNTDAQNWMDSTLSHRNPSVLLAATQLLHRLENLFREDYRKSVGAAEHIDHKRRRKLQERKQAQGHARDDHAPQIH